MSARALRVAWRVLRAEGVPGLRARTRERLEERRRARSFAPVDEAWRPHRPVSVLNLLPMRPSAQLGGVPIQLLVRLEAEARHRDVALLAPARRGWRLEVRVGGDRRVLALPGPPPTPEVMRDDSVADLVRRAMATAGAGLLHVEGLAGVPLASLLDLRAELPRLVLSLHDFAAFCPRPHLLERPVARFCDYCRDLDRCGRCLATDWPLDGAWQGKRRETAAALLTAADALIFPSRFMARAHAALFPEMAWPPELAPLEAGVAEALAEGAKAPAGCLPGRARVAVVRPPVRLPRRLPPVRPPRPPRNLACVGAVKPHKGADVAVATIARLAAAGAPVRWTIYGGGDPELLARLRSLPGVRVRGYYRAEELPALLHRDAIDLALLLSTLPESYSMTLDECRAAGVPCLAFDLGALGERLREGGGVVVPPDGGADAVATALLELVRGERPCPAVPTALRPTAAVADEAAAGAMALYRELGLGASEAIEMP